jgi:ribosomal protein S18 acetylase RimI-like enzyme
MNRNTIILYEELSMNAHPALKMQLFDGWILRFSDGYTNRANSISPLYESHMPYIRKVSVCEKLYLKQELPTIFKLTDASEPGLDEYLGSRGYEVAKPTFLYIKKSISQHQSGANVFIKNHADQEWCDDFFRLNEIKDPVSIRAAAALLKSIPNDVLCAQIVEDGRTIACGLCVIERGFAGLYDIVVDQEHRSRGFGFELCSSLLDRAAHLGAKEAYLQVVASNISAIALYKKLGFSYSYQYWYRVKKSKRAKKPADFIGVER